MNNPVTGRHSAPDWVGRAALELVRCLAEHPEYRGIMAGSMGADRFHRMVDDFRSHDSWENEGGALAHVYR